MLHSITPAVPGILLLTLLNFYFSHINEDKRKTEGQKQIFDVVYEVDGCPVSLSAAVEHPGGFS